MKKVNTMTEKQVEEFYDACPDGYDVEENSAEISIAIVIIAFILFYSFHFLSRSAPLYGLFSASAYNLTFFLFVACRACYAVLR